MTWLIVLVLTPVAVGMLLSPGGRLILVMSAGLLVFTPGRASFTPKFIFLALLLFSSALAITRIRHTGLRPTSWLIASMVGLVSTLFVAALNGWAAEPQATLQNGLPYLLVLLVLPLAVDAGLGSSRRLLETGLLVVGMLGALSFTTHWLARRGVSTLDADGLLATSLLMPALVFQWGLVSAGEKDRSWALRILAISVSLVVPFALLVTGTRSALVLAVGFASFLFWTLTKKKAMRTLIVAVVAVGTSIPLLGWLASELLIQTDFLSRRIAALQQALLYGSFGDESFAARRYSTEIVLSMVERDWLFGLGLSTPEPIMTFDTPLSTVMRIGIAGSFFLVMYLVAALHWAMTTIPKNARGDAIRAMIIGWLLVVLTYGALLNPPTDDRLFAFAFAIAIALAINARHGDAQATSQTRVASRSGVVVVGLPAKSSANLAKS
jgi:hypothetical protein